MTDSARFWSKTADRYASSPVKDPATYEKTLDRARAYLSPDDHVLEVGCGTGTTALLLAPDVRQILASDFAARMIEIAREKASAEGVSNVRFETGTIFDDALTPGSFDAVLAFNVLHLFDDLPGALGRAVELLKPGGVLISKTVCLADQTRLWAIPITVMQWLGLAPSVELLTTGGLERALEGAGFEIVETCSFPASVPSRFVVARNGPARSDGAS